MKRDCGLNIFSCGSHAFIICRKYCSDQFFFQKEMVAQQETYLRRKIPF